MNPCPDISESFLWMELPLTPYGEAAEMQRQIVAAKKEKRLKKDAVLILEHPPIFTLGRNRGREHLMVSEKFLAEKNMQVVQTERGGNITFHGPGQLVVYPILDMNAGHIGIREYVEGLEKIMSLTVREWGIDAHGDAQNRGLWIGNRKLGSIGVAVKHGICFHGLALNVNMDLEPFTWINPCGLCDIQMSTVEKESGKKISVAQVRTVLKKHMAGFLKKQAVDTDFQDLF
ncbi:MAG: lipoyl(octanoyl) transferase LipB [Desulfobacterales bacterium]